MRKRNCLCITFFLISLGGYAQERITISGFVREKSSLELLPGVHISIDKSEAGAVTNSYGFYSITIPKSDSVSLIYSFVGYTRKHLAISAQTSYQYNVQLDAAENQLNEVLILDNRATEKQSQSAQMSQVEIPVNQVKKIPALLGEKDVIRALQLMPGVQKGSEGQTGLYVRGGGPDQNLIILDDAIVYNASHLFGFFSVFNGDALKSVQLTKGGFPARYGGRLSSVVDMSMKEGNKEKIHGEGGIGLLSSRLTLEGPLIKKKASFLVAGRRTYIDALAAPFISRQSGDGSTYKPGYFFYDFNAKLNFDLGMKDKLYLSGYFGKDKFSANETLSDVKTKAGMNWGNTTGTLRWNHLLGQRLFVNSSLILSSFRFNTFSAESQQKKIKLLWSTT
jgi:hypothetical protein